MNKKICLNFDVISDSQQANLYLDKLVELENALVQRKLNAEFNVPVVAIFGLEKQGERTLLVEDAMAQDSSNDTEVQDDDEDISQIDEDSDIIEIMEELEDSTDSRQW